MELDPVEQLTLAIVRQHGEGLLPADLRTLVCQQHDVKRRDVRSAIARLWARGYINLGHDCRIRPVDLGGV